MTALKPNLSLRVHGHLYHVQTKYAEGYVLNANEARALEQLRIRHVQAAFRLFAQRARAKGRVPTQEDLDLLAATFAFPEALYKRRQVPPVDKKELELATQAVKELIKEKYQIEPHQVLEGDVHKMIGRLIDRGTYRQQAEAACGGSAPTC